MNRFVNLLKSKTGYSYRWLALNLCLPLLGLLLVACGNPYICANGTPAIGRVAAAGTSRCVSCNPDASLVGTANTIGAHCHLIALGAAQQIGNAMLFGLSGEGEDAPTGLAAIGDTLYMVGQNTAALYTLNIRNGRATKVGNADQFGEGVTIPTGLAVINNTLYMVGSDTEILYTLNTVSGEATPIGPIGGGEGQPYGLAAIGDTLYMVGSITDALHTLNTANGSATRVGGVSQFNVNEDFPAGLAAIGDTLYMVGAGRDALYRFNGGATPDGSAARIGNVEEFDASENAPTGLAAIGSALYMAGTQNDALYSLRYQE